MNKNRAANTTLELLIMSGILLFFVLSIIAYYALLSSNMAVVSVFNGALSDTSVCGGYDIRVERNLYANLLARGLIDGGGLTDISAIIAADKASEKRQVIVECSADMTAGGSPAYRSYSAADTSGIWLKISVLQQRERAFLAAVNKLIAPAGTSIDDGYLTLNGYVLSELPKPVN